MSDTPELDITAAVEAAARVTHREDHNTLWTDETQTLKQVYRYMARAATDAALPHLLAQIGEGIAMSIEADAKHATGVFLKVAPPTDDWHYGYIEGCERGKERAAIIARNCWRKP